MYVCVHIYIYICMCIYIYIHTHICVCMYICIYVSVLRLRLRRDRQRLAERREAPQELVAEGVVDDGGACPGVARVGLNKCIEFACRINSLTMLHVNRWTIVWTFLNVGPHEWHKLCTGVRIINRLTLFQRQQTNITYVKFDRTLCIYVVTLSITSSNM